MGCYFISDRGEIFGKVDDTKWKNAKWYQKIIGRLFKNYKHKFMVIKPLDIKTIKT